MTKLADRTSQILKALGNKVFSYNDAYQTLKTHEPTISPTNTNFLLNSMKKSGLIESTSPGKMKVK